MFSSNLGQLMTTLCSSAFNNSATTGCLHPLAETVAASSSAIMGLKCPFHIGSFQEKQNGKRPQ
jgi:hypothetical protein